jgi:hypothetical protein
MTATYYAIVEFNKSSQKKGEIVLEGIVRNSEDTIYPQQETGIEDLPYECELHHFESKGYIIETCNFVITRDIVKQYRTSGDKIQ